MNGYDLIEPVNGIYIISERGKKFVSGKENEIIREIDVEEGCVFILYLVSIYNNSKRNKFLQDWSEYLMVNSNYRKESVIKDSLRRRFVNLMEREYLIRKGNSYNITEEGIRYLSTFNKSSFKSTESINVSKAVQLNREIEGFINEQKEFLREKLSTLHPYKFENLIKDLLQEIGYDDVQVTSATNDKGIDVTGTIQNGITSVKEVIQVKRLTSNVQRNVLDSLRGCLHRFDAVKGTIITLSDFSKGAKDAAFEKGAAPITLINGEKLIDLLIENEIAVKKKQIDTFTVDNEYFSETKEEELE